MNTKIYKIIDGIMWIIGIIGIILMICALYQLNEVKGDIKEYKRITRIK
jgi:uncharacterized membrane protein